MLTWSHFLRAGRGVFFCSNLLSNFIQVLNLTCVAGYPYERATETRSRLFSIQIQNEFHIHFQNRARALVIWMLKRLEISYNYVFWLRQLLNVRLFLLHKTYVLDYFFSSLLRFHDFRGRYFVFWWLSLFLIICWIGNHKIGVFWTENDEFTLEMRIINWIFWW